MIGGPGGCQVRIGVFLGGVITEWISWPWVFLINLPIAALVLAAAPGLMPGVNRQKRSGSRPRNRWVADDVGSLQVESGDEQGKCAGVSGRASSCATRDGPS